MVVNETQAGPASLGRQKFTGPKRLPWSGFGVGRDGTSLMIVVLLFCSLQQFPACTHTHKHRCKDTSNPYEKIYPSATRSGQTWRKMESKRQRLCVKAERERHVRRKRRLELKVKYTIVWRMCDTNTELFFCY